MEELLSRLSVELGALEDAYITSRYVARSYTCLEAERLRAAVEEVISIVRRAVGERG